MTFAVPSSTTMKSPSVSAGVVQLVEIAIERTSGKAEATHEPRYGMKRSTMASSPHRNAFGMPRK